MELRILSIFKKTALLAWKYFPIPSRLREFALYTINHKFIVGVLAVITNDKGELLLVHHTYYKEHAWGLPGGAAKKENLINSIERELDEEMGCTININYQIGVFHDGSRRLELLFDCSIIDINFKGSTEVDKYQYFRLDQLPGIAYHHKPILNILLTSAKESKTYPYLDLRFIRNNWGKYSTIFAQVK